MKKLLFSFLILAVSLSTFAQKELGSFSATGSGIATAYLSDYQCLGINPANLGFKRSPSIIHLSFLEVGVSVFSDALNKEDLKHDFVFGGKTHFTKQEKIDAAEAFVNNKFSLNADVSHLSFSFQKSNLGGIAFAIREHTAFNSYFNKDFAQLIFEGYNAPYFDSYVVNGTDTTGVSSAPKTFGQIADGSRISSTWYREYILGYGRKVFEGDKISLYVGADAKYIRGYGMLDINAENGTLSGFSALTPFLNVNYASTSPSQIIGNALKTVGSGIGFDLGATLTLLKKLNVSASINDIGSVKWDGNVYEVKDTLVNNVTNKGFFSFSMIKEIKNLIQDSTLFNWKGDESRTINLATNIRLGASYKFGKLSNVGVDVYVPVNDKTANYDKAFVSVGANFGIGKILILSTGVGTGGNYENIVIPAGITLLGKKQKTEIGIASRDAITFFRNNNPTISAVFGFLRINLGKTEE